MSEIIGTPYYVAPEILKGRYTEKWDIWSVGVMMFLLLSGSLPFEGNNTEAICKAVYRGDFQFTPNKWNKVSQSAKDLISDMLVKDPNKRISAAEALKHEWFKKYEAGIIKEKSLILPCMNILKADRFNILSKYLKVFFLLIICEWNRIKCIIMIKIHLYLIY